MGKKILIVNTGSASRKYALYEDSREICRFHLEKEGDGFVAGMKMGETEETRKISDFEYANSVDFALKFLTQEVRPPKGGRTSLDETAVAVRIVAPGNYFLSHKVVDEDFFTRLREAESLAPLHIKPIVAEIEQVRKFLPRAEIVGISDSAFHKTLPEVVRRLAIPEPDALQFGICKFGYHGISAASLVYKIKNWLGKIPERVIVCHLGSGVSITALKNGESVDTSMGLTPLDGPPMGSRVGAIDPGAVLALGGKKGLSLSELEEYFNKECGLLALSGKTKDVKELLDLEKSGDEKAKLALDSFVYSIKKYIGAYTASLGGLDLLVFTATIGERSPIIRERICSGLQGLGLVLDEEKNDVTVDVDGFVHRDGETVEVAVITTDEMGQIVREAALMI